MHHHELTGAWIWMLCACSTTSASLRKDASPCHVETDCWDWYVEDVRHVLESHALLDTICCFCQFCFWPTDSGGSDTAFLPWRYRHLPLVRWWQYTHDILQSHCSIHIWNRNIVLRWINALWSYNIKYLGDVVPYHSYIIQHKNNTFKNNIFQIMGYTLLMYTRQLSCVSGFIEL